MADSTQADVAGIDNPSAFPCAPGDVAYWNEGMTLRDWFAGQALAAIVRTCAGDTRDREQPIEGYFAAKAYGLADAMLVARADHLAAQVQA